MEVPAGLIEEIDRYADLIARAAADSSMDTPVPTCPDWTLRDLVVHIGSVNRWAARHVDEYSPVRIPGASMDFGVPDTDDGLADWLRAGGKIMAETFAGADGDRPMWAWGADQHARFWPRRMLHETTVHRADAEFALGINPAVQPDRAADGVDEFLDNLPCAVYFAPNVEHLKGEGETLAFVADDAGTAWLVTLGTDGFTWARARGAATVQVTGSAGDLLLLLYGRRRPDEGRFAVEGDRATLDFWLANSSI